MYPDESIHRHHEEKKRKLEATYQTDTSSTYHEVAEDQPLRPTKQNTTTTFKLQGESFRERQKTVLDGIQR